MIIGNGDLASVLKDKEELTFFASGVSDSSETRRSEFDREINLLLAQEARHIVYFSSLCVFYSNTPYANHKREMEDLVKRFDKYTIIRLGNITWGNNPKTIIIFFKNEIKSNHQLIIQDVYRYLVTEKELSHWIDLIPSWSCEINIPGRRLKAKDIVKEIKEGKL